MKGNDIVILVGIIVAAIVVFFAVRRFSKLRLKVNIPFGHKNISGEMTGEEGTNRSPSATGFTTRVHTNIKGDVKSSDVVTAGGSIGASSSEKGIGNNRDASTAIDGSVQDSRIFTASKDVTTVKQTDEPRSSTRRKD